MSFRKPKSDEQRQVSEWRAWVDLRREELKAIGLAPEVYLDADRWEDFLENGWLDRHASNGFSFDQLSHEQMAALHRFLEREYGGQAKAPNLLERVRVRLTNRRQH